MNFSTWDSIPPSRSRNPALSSSHLIIEFERTKKIRIFEHKLSQIDLNRDEDVNIKRNEIIDRELESLRYNNISHVYSELGVTVPLNSGDFLEYPEFEIYSHGTPRKDGDENCAQVGLQCKENSGSNIKCQRGKCIIGTLKRVKNTKWKYESSNLYGENLTPVSYFVSSDKEIKLKPIYRGRYKTFTNINKEVIEVGIDFPASIPVKIYLPPKFYLEDFVEASWKDENAIEFRKERFIRNVVVETYPNSQQSVISAELAKNPTEQIKNTLIKRFETLPQPWVIKVNSVIEEEFDINSSGLNYISEVYDKLSSLFSGILQVVQSSASSPRFSYDKERTARPVYSRLPGISEAYRSDPSFSDIETPTQWLTSGVDSFLSQKKDDIAAFYQNYLDPETCSEFVLDWLAQHVGLFGELWNSEWNRGIKEAMIRNAFGWWDREITNDVGELTPKGEALEKFPFTNPEWVDSFELDNFLKIKKDETETLVVNNDGKLLTYQPFKSFQEGQLVVLDSIKINKTLWNGLIEAKGSFLAVMFLISLFGLKSHSPEELEIIDLERKILKPKSGLRNAEISAPPLIPHKYDIIQVGSDTDLEIGNYANQLVAGVSRASSIEDSRNVFFRVPFYYNRDGKSWDRVSYIAKNWMPGNLNVRVQYPYLAADLWQVGDAFFEPDIVISEQ